MVIANWAYLIIKGNAFSPISILKWNGVEGWKVCQ
jgi:hypothetical protein